MNDSVKAYIEKQASPKREIVQKLRDIIVETFPDIKEEFKNGVPWYEGKFYIGAMKNQVNLGFSIMGLSKDEVALLEGGGKTMRHVKIHTLEDIEEKEITKLLKLVWEKTACVE